MAEPDTTSPAHASKNGTDPDPAPLYALLSQQGTAMNETALCANHLGHVEVREMIERDSLRARRGNSDDWDGDEWADVSGNEYIDEQGCVACGNHTLIERLVHSTPSGTSS